MEESGAYKFITHEATPVMYRDTIKPGLRPMACPCCATSHPRKV